MRRKLIVPALLAGVFIMAWIGLARGDDAPPAVTISNYAFSPSPITVTVGQTVRFTNQDDVPHTITEKNGAFDSGTLDKGKSWSYKFTKAGTYAYYCTVHPSMNGSVIVTSP